MLQQLQQQTSVAQRRPQLIGAASAAAFRTAGVAGAVTAVVLIDAGIYFVAAASASLQPLRWAAGAAAAQRQQALQIAGPEPVVGAPLAADPECCGVREGGALSQADKGGAQHLQ